MLLNKTNPLKTTIINLKKKQLRIKYLKLRKKLSTDQVQKSSQKIFSSLQQISQFKQAKTFFIYLATGNEVQTQDLIVDLLKHNKVVTIPKVINRHTMIPVQIFDLNSLQKNHFGILEPSSTKKFSKKLDIAIVPGLAFTKEGNRLGMGGGYYDKFLTENPDIYSIGLGYDFQMTSKLPTTQHDKKLSLIATTH